MRSSATPRATAIRWCAISAATASAASSTTRPSILHYGRPEDGPVLREGMFFTVEPMINAGRWEVKVLSDGWTAVTKDRSLSAQFEHTIGVTATGYEIFTISPAGLHRPPYDLSSSGRKSADRICSGVNGHLVGNMRCWQAGFVCR